jgi:hypothetical protein
MLIRHVGNVGASVNSHWFCCVQNEGGKIPAKKKAKASMDSARANGMRKITSSANANGECISSEIIFNLLISSASHLQKLMSSNG